MDNSLQEIMNNTLDNLRGIVKSEDMVFKPIYLDDKTMAIPLTKVSVGFVSGGGGGETNKFSDLKSDKLQPYAGGGGGGISLSPMGFLVFSDNQTTLVKVDEKASEGKWKDLISATLNLVKDKK
ncbi:MAG: hypothetical protein K2G37_02695 [Clostridia bacterium]|nr:hypothetical protein [Clostridia bacterium]MDE7328740.1 hypothetical protein [Clostridia bacterium]